MMRPLRIAAWFLLIFMLATVFVSAQNAMFNVITINEWVSVAGISGVDILRGDGTKHCLVFNNNYAGDSGCIPQTVINGTAAMTTALIATVACGTTVTVAAT